MVSLDSGQFKLTNKKAFPVYGIEEKALYTLVAADGSTSEVVMKDVSRFCPVDVTPSDWYLELWKKYISAGVTTHEWMVRYDDNNVITPNLYQDGWRIYGKSSSQMLIRGEFAVRTSETDLLLLAINEKEIKDLIEKHIEKASEAGIVLPHDDRYELCIHSSGFFEVRTLDLTHTVLRDPLVALYDNTVAFDSALQNIRVSQHLLKLMYQQNPKLFSSARV